MPDLAIGTLADTIRSIPTSARTPASVGARAGIWRWRWRESTCWGPPQVKYAQKIYPFFEQVARGVRTRLKGSFQAAPKLPPFGEGNMAMEKLASIAIALVFIRASIGES